MDASLDTVQALILSGENEEDEEVLRDLLQERNHSILAHGLMPIGKNTAHQFLDYVGGVVKTPESRLGTEHVRLRKL